MNTTHSKTVHRRTKYRDAHHNYTEMINLYSVVWNAHPYSENRNRFNYAIYCTKRRKPRGVNCLNAANNPYEKCPVSRNTVEYLILCFSVRYTRIWVLRDRLCVYAFRTSPCFVDGFICLKLSVNWIRSS